VSDEIPRRVGTEKAGTWSIFLFGEATDAPRYSAVVWCKECSRPLSLVNHAIAPDGIVTPSIGHPDQYRRPDGTLCAWHPTARLLDWPNLPNPAVLALHSCEQCGKQSRTLGGWGTWSGGTGLLCPECIAARNVVRP